MNQITESFGIGATVGLSVLWIIIGVVVVIAIIMILRTFVCWYFRINETVALLSDIRSLLSKRQAASVKTGSELPEEVEITPEMIEAKFGKPDS